MTDEALAGGAVPERAGLVGRVDLLEVGHPDDADVAAGGDRLHAVLGLAPPERPEARPEADEELGDLHARALGGDVVAGLVEHDHAAMMPTMIASGATVDGREDGEHDQAERGPASDDAGRRRRVDVDAGVLERVLHAALRPVGRRRPRGALARDPVRLQNVGDVVDVPGAALSSTSATTSAMASHGIRPAEERLDRDLVGAR